LNLTVNPAVTSTTNTTICDSQLPYTWNGQTISAAGTYTANLTSAAGCDSIATLNLAVNAAVTSTTNTTICSSQLPYSWNAQTLNTAGTYTANLISAAGCDSVATLNLTVNPVVTSTTNTTICSTQLPYAWNGQTLSAAGTYTANLTSAAGCDSVATLNLAVNPAVTSTTNKTICANQLPYSWNGQTLNAAGTYTANLTSAAGCDSVATLNLTVNPAVTSTTNTTICASQLPYSWNGQTLNAAGTYTANLISAAGCDSIATLNLVVNAAVTSTTNTTICANQLPYSWNGQVINAAGTYTANLISAEGCDSVATLNLAVNPAVTSTTNTTTCANQLPYSWNGQTITAAGTYTANLTSAAGCDSVATLNLAVNAAVTSTTNTTICSSQLPYSWNGQTINAAGTYTANLTSAAGCDSVATLSLAVNPAVTSTTNTTICANQLPYSWNGQTLNAAGTYTANLISAAGCDSIATLNLVVNAAVTSTTNTMICASQLPYTWNGQTLNAAGTYTANLTSASGCDSVATLNLAVNPVVTSTTNTAICSTQLPYVWNGQTLNAAGTYTANLTSAAGCDSVATLNLTVNPAVTSATNTTICSSQLPYSWNGQTLNAAGTYTANLTSAAGCDSVATLNLAVNAAVTSTTNTTICSSQLPYTWNGQTLTAAGTYTANLTSAAGCDSVATLNLAVNAAVTNTTNTTICANQLPYSWNGQTLTATGTYTANLTSAAGCDSVATLNLTVNPAVTSTTNTTICASQLPYSWNGQIINAAGTYTANLTSAAGCDSIATLNLAVNAAVTSTTNTSICANQLPYSWNGQTISAAGTYTANLTSAAGCDSVATLNLAVNAAVTSMTNTTICSNQLPYSWNGQVINAAGTYTANLTSAAGCDSVATLNLTVNPVVTSITNTTICLNQLPYSWNGQILNAAGTYTANLTSAAGCDSVATLNLAVNPAVTSTTNTTICASQLPYSWNGQSITAAGTYTANLTSAAGCDSVATLNLAVNPVVTSTTNTIICSSQLPYTWNGQTINVAGTYTANLTSVAGCDSIATLNLAVAATPTSTTNTTICSSQLPYSWNGQSINAAGAYTANLTSVAGCDSVATLNLAVNPAVTSTTNTTICANQLPYIWNGQNINTAGTYTANLMSAAGCDSIATLNLTVTATLTSTTNTTICASQLPYTWNGQIINAAGTYTANLTSAAGCDSIATLNLAVNPVVISTTNTTICASQLPYTWNSQTLNAAGTYTANLTSAAGCDSVATLNLAVSAAVTSTTNTTICSSQLPYTWNGQTINAAGTYTANLTSAAGCDSVATLNLAVNAAVTSTTNTTICANQLPYSWNGQTISAAGTYTANLTSAAGCDSIATLNLVVTATLTSTTNITICANQLPYSWNGQVINTAGTYTANLTSAAGCDSVATLNLAVTATLTSTTNTTICASQLPYSWNGQSVNAAGTYTAHLTSAAGCDSVATLNLAVKPAVTSTTNTTICASQLPYSWNGQSITAAGTYTANLTSAAGCDSIAALNLTVNPARTSTTNTTICASQLPYSWNGQTISAAGTYTANLTSAAGCDSVATLNLTVNAAVTSTTNATICASQLPYSWNGQSINAAGTYTANLTSAAGCDSVATLNLAVNPVVTSTTNTTICANQLPYSWNGQAINAAGTYTAGLTSAAGCDSMATLNLAVTATLTSTTNTTICSNQLPYSWNGQTINAAGTYTANLISAAGCDSVATLNLAVNPVVTSTTNTTICASQLPYSWNGQTINAAGAYKANLISAAGCDSVATLNLAVTATLTSTTNSTICSSQLPYSWNGQALNAAGTYTANLTSAAGCDSIATLNLTISPAVNSTNNTTICASQLPYTWNGQTINAAGTYTANLISAAGCDSIATLNLVVNAVLTSTTNTTICSSQLPYSWNGQTINAAGTYTANLTSATGCDSIATLSLAVNPVVTSTTNTTICASQLPYSWSGQTISAAGTYTANLTSAAGCDSVATLNLAVNSAVTSTTNTTICANQLPYSWNGQSITAAGMYSANLTSAAGCDSIATLNLAVNPAVTSTTNTTICSSQLPYTWNGQTINAAGTYTANLTSASGCDSIATLNLAVNAAVTSTTNTTICSSQLPYTWNGQSISAAGTYTANLTSAAGCDSVATLNLVVNPVVTNTTNTTICSSQLPYSWNGQTINAAGIYTANLTSAAGCDSIATLNLAVTATLTSSTNTTICSSQLPYTWNGQSIGAAGTYTANLTSAAGCDSVATLNLAVTATLASTTNTTICSSQLPYTWNAQTIITAGTYTANLVGTAGCDSIATLNLAVNAAVTSTTNTTICSSQLPYSWNGQTLNAAGTYTANLTSAAGCDSVATLNLVVTATLTSTTNTTICSSQLPYSWNGQSISAAGTYTANLTSAAGCDSIATLNLVVNPAVASTTNTTICSNQLPYTWNGQTFNAAGTYTANLTSAAGCDSVATLNLAVNAAVTSTTNTTICSNQLPYTWNGQSLTTAGTYTANLTSAAGCDSIATLNLAVTATLTSSTNTTICSSQLPYSWNGQILNVAGTYTANLTSAAGCDSIATLNLVVTGTLTSTTNTTICASQLPYSWNGQAIGAAGTYTANLISAAGCDSVATLNLVVTATLTSTTNTTICASQLPYSWNGQTLGSAGTYTANLTSAAGCDSIATLNLAVNPVVSSTTNTTICASQLPYSWNGQSITAAGTYTANLTSAAGCDSVATLNLAVNPMVTSTTNTTICSSQLPYSWNGQTISAAGTYTANLTSAASCDSVATLNLLVTATLTSTTNTTICSSQLPYTWNGQTINAAGTYTANLTSAAGCDSIATLNLVVTATLTSTTNTTICSSQLPYTWNGQTINAAGTYTANLTSAAGCDSVATLNLAVTATLTSTTNMTTCANQLPYSWNGQAITAAGTYTANLTSAAGCDSIATLDLVVTATLTSMTNTTICSSQLPYTWNGQTISAAGTYTANLTGAAGCDSVATLNLAVTASVTSTTNTTICSNQLPYTWNGQSITAAGTYTANLTSATGCDSVASLNLTVSPAVTSTTNTAICASQLPYTWNGQSISTSGTYTANLTSAAGCDSVATLNLTVSPAVTSTTNAAICSSQLPYSWNGLSINATGTYTANLISVAGCDSVATLNLVVTATLTSTTNTTICSSQLPYNWNGQSLTSAGTHTANLTSAAGCDSVATLNLTIAATLTSTTNTTICSSQLPYSWNGQSINAAGTYTANLTSAAGCDSVATLNLMITATLTSTTNTTICSSQLPYTWNGQTITTTGTYTANLTSAAGCDSVATLNLAVNPAVTSTTNTTICAGQLPYSWNGQTLTAAGTYTANLTSAAGCDSVATLNLTVSPVVTSTTNTTICSNQLPYTWNGQPITTAGTYTANLTSAAGCDSVATLNLVVTATVTSTTNTTICSNQLPYTWNGQSITAAGTYTANLTSAAGCDSIATLSLTVNPTVTSMTNTTICASQLPYTWNGQTVNSAGTYTANLTSAAGCDSVATLNLAINPAVTSTTNTTICASQLPYSWNGQTLTAAGTYTANLTSAAGCDSIATLNLGVTATLTSTTNTTICSNRLPYNWNGQSLTSAGTYTANLTSAAGCDSIATLNLTVNPAITSTTNTTICSNQLPYTWNGQSITAAGTYTANLTSAAGCDSVATVNLLVTATLTNTTNTAICANQLPYSWNGQSITAAGTYTANLTSAAGCDSVATLNLSVTATLTSITNLTICSNQLPYSWNGQSITAAGTYTANLIGAAGCDSVATLNLGVTATLTSTTNTTICSNQLPYTWNGQSITAAGTYSANLISAAGCDSVATLNLMVTAMLTSTTNTTICANQLPYSWNGQSITAAGTYTANLTSAAGCDSIVTLNLTVNPVVTSTTNTIICSSQLPYTWNGQTINAAGTYMANLTSASGCDSIATLNLAVNPTVTSTTTTTICSSQLPYTWNGQILTAAGTYTANLTSAAGCDSVVTLSLAVNPMVTSTTNTTICSSQLPYSWNGQTLTAAGTYTANLASVAGCDSIATLNLVVTATLTSTTNTTICSSQLPYTWNGQTLTVTGTYTANLTSVAGCDSVATLNLVVTSTLTSTTNTTICSSQLPYTWNGQTLIAAGTYTANLTSAAGCDSIATLNLVVTSTLTSTTNTTICASQLPYTWNGQTISAAGTYTANLISAAGCDSIATLNLAVTAILTSTTNTKICPNQLPYSWNGQTINAAGTYTANLTSAAGCDSVATLNLAVTATLTSTTNTTICANQLPYSWNGQTISAAGTYTVNLTSAAGCDSVATLNLAVTATLTSTTNTTICSSQLPYTWNGQTLNAAGTYTANLTSAAGCDSIATLNLVVNPVVTSTTNTTICSSQLPYNWNGQTITAAGTYTANLTSAAGCDSVATLNLIVNSIVTSTTNTTICSSQLPYTWNGQTINAAGNYTANLTSAAGCDSVATLNLVVTSTLTSTTNTTICANQLPYSWNGQTINAAGTYTANLTSAAGCDSIATLNLVVTSTLTSTTNMTICSSQLPYTWNGQSINAAGTYTANLTSAAGCDSVATLNLAVNPVVTSTTNTTICANQLPYNWDGQTINAAGTYTANLTSAAGCDSIATLNLVVTATLTSTTNTRICSSQLPYTWNGQTINAAGMYTVNLTSAAGCDSVATLNLAVTATLTSTTNTTICSSQLPYSWNGQSISAAGTYTANLTSAAGCDSVATLNLAVNPAVTSTTNATICSSQLPYSWNGQTINAAGTYTANLTSAAGCDSVATLNLLVTATLTSTTNTTICANQLPYGWNGQTISAAGTYTANLTSAAGCDSVATLNLVVTATLTSTKNTTICANQLPYSWNGQTISAAGTYTANLTSASGCDSVATLNLMVTATLTSTTNTAICSNQLPYSWNGQIINAAGTYKANLTSAAGCDSIATLNLTLNPVVTSTTNKTICSNQLPYSWNGQVMSAAGTYKANLTSAAGCDSVATLNLAVNATLTSTTNTTICGSQLPYSWNGRSIGAAGTYTANLKTVAGCDSVVTLNLAVNPTSSSTTRITICSSLLPYAWNGRSLTTAGTYTVNLTSANGCDSVAQLILTVNAAAMTTQDVSTCLSSYTLPDGTVATTSGVYTSLLKTVVGCDSIVTTRLRLLPPANLVVSDPPTTCTQSTVNLTAAAITAGSDAGLTYTYWKDAATSIALGNASAVTDSGTYYIKATNAGGCSQVRPVRVVIEGSPTLIVHNPGAVCMPATIDITAPSVTAGSDPGLTYTYWQDPDGTVALINPNAVANDSTYYIKGSAVGGCFSIKPVKSSFNQPPAAAFNGNEAICAGNTAILKVSFTGKAPWTLTYSDGSSSSIIPNITTPEYSLIVGPKTTTTYSLQSVADAACTANSINSTATVTVRPAIEGIRYPTLDAFAFVATPLSARILGSQYSYNWSPATGLDLTTVPDPIFNYGISTQYQITLTSDSGCVTVDTVLVHIINPGDTNLAPNLFVPKAWSPNNDGKNDKLFPFTYHIRKLNYFRIFDRWGRLVFETTTLGAGWDGVFNGRPQVMDVYTWTVEAIGDDGSVIKRSGNSILLR